jgi:hypothetical protein
VSDAKRRQPLQERANGEGADGADREDFLHPTGLEALEQAVDRAERFEQSGRERHALVGQLQPPVRAAEQFNAELALQRLDLMADRSLRDAQLVRRLGERQVPGRGFERQRIQGDRGSRHLIPSFPHALTDKLSLVHVGVSLEALRVGTPGRAHPH